MTKTHEQLEQLVDRVGVATLIDWLAEICWEKADHVRSAWQDERGAKLWERNGDKLHKVAQQLD